MAGCSALVWLWIGSQLLSGVNTGPTLEIIHSTGTPSTHSRQSSAGTPTVNSVPTSTTAPTKTQTNDANVTVITKAYQTTNTTSATTIRTANSTVETTSSVLTSLANNSTIDITTQSNVHSKDSTAQTTTQSSIPWKGNTAQTTTQSSIPWKDMTYGLTGTCFLLLVVCIVTLIVIFTLKRKLKKCHTLYIGGNDHVYQDLTPSGRKKAEVKVELKAMTKMHNEEVIDSPVFSPSPPFHSHRLSINDKRPPVPNREPPNLPPPRKIASKKDLQSNQNVNKGINNEAFYQNENPSQSKTMNSSPTNTGIVSSGLYDDDDDEDLYEKYQHTQKYNSAMIEDVLNKIGETHDAEDNLEDTVLEDLTTYEEPVKSSSDNTDEFIRRQNSSTGLPDMINMRSESREQEKDIPLQGINEDLYDNARFGQIEIDSGLPNMTALATFDDLQCYDDVEEIETNTKKSMERNDLSNRRLPGNDLQFGIEDNDDITLYEDGELAEFDRSPSASLTKDNAANNPEHDIDALPIYEDGDVKYDDGTEGNIDDLELYEDFQHTSDTSTDKAESTLPSNERMEFEEEINSADKNNEMNKNILQTNKTSFSEDISSINKEQGQNQIMNFPKVPPRKDIVTKQTSSSSPDTLTQPGEAHDEITTVHMRPGRQISNHVARNSYFLDMDDNTPEISEAEQRRISVHGDFDLQLNASGVNKAKPLFLNENYTTRESSKDTDHTVGNETEFPMSNMDGNLAHESIAINGALPNTTFFEQNVENGHVDIGEMDDDDIYDVPSRTQRNILQA